MSADKNTPGTGPTPFDLMLGSTSPHKVVHHSTCRYALTDYVWARQFPTLRRLADELVTTGAWRWHRACRVCCQGEGDLIDHLLAALERGPLDA